MDAPALPPPPRLVDYISSLQGLVRLGDLADLEPDKSVVVVVSGCYPLEDAPILFDDLSARETWCVIGMPELCILRARAISLLQRREDLRALVRDMGHDLLVCGTESGKAEGVLARALKLPAGMDAPPGISLDLVGDADEGRRFLRRDIARARLQLAALAGHTERHILRRLGRELALRASTGVVAPQELWPDIQEQRLRHAPPDSTSDAALYAEAAEEAAWVAPAGTPPDSDA